MPEPSPSTAFLDDVVACVTDALAALDRHEAAVAGPPAAADQKSHAVALGQLEESLSGWQALLGDMAERVRAAQDDLAGLDADLKRSLDAFGAARKFLQGEAASGPGA